MRSTRGSPPRRGANTSGCEARCRRKTGSAADAYHDLPQSAALLDLLGERYQAALSHLALGRLVAETGARSVAERHLNRALAIFAQLGAERDLEDTHAAQALLTSVGTGQYVISPADADDAIVRRIVDAAALPELLGRETAAALLEAAAADCSVVFVELAGGDVRVIASAGCEADAARDHRSRRARTATPTGEGPSSWNRSAATTKDRASASSPRRGRSVIR